MRRLAFVLLVLAACGDSPSSTPDAGPPDAMPFHPAPHRAPPQVKSFGGPVITAPKVVPIWFTGDDNFRTGNDQFLTAFTATDQWAQMVGEYGVGPLTVAPDIVTSDPVPTATAELEPWLTSMSDGTHAGWPVPDGNTIYTVFLPPGAVFDDEGSSNCNDWYGFHWETRPATGTGLIYAVIGRCTREVGNYFDWMTSIETHEFAEAATDPRFDTAPAFRDMDMAHELYRILPGAEVGDMCEHMSSANARIVGTYKVQREWSNAAAAADRDPCVPAPATAYVEATPELDDDVMVPTFDGPSVLTKGVSIPIGSTKTVTLDLWSDRPTGDFQLEAQVWSGNPGDVEVVLDKNFGHDGDKVGLQIHVVAAGSFGGAIVRVATVVGTDEVGESWIWVKE